MGRLRLLLLVVVGVERAGALAGLVRHQSELELSSNGREHCEGLCSAHLRRAQCSEEAFLARVGGGLAREVRAHACGDLLLQRLQPLG